MSLLFAAAIAAVPFLLALQPANGPIDTSSGRIEGFENARESAREYFVRNPRLEVDTIGQMILDAEWLVATREAAAAEDAQSGREIRLPPSLLARSQSQLDGLIDGAYQARMIADPAWRLGVLDVKTPELNYIAHAFVHDPIGGGWAGVTLCVLVLLLAGAPLERTWGSPIFAAFVFGTIPIVAQAYRLLDGSGGVPWSGGAGLAGALLGAYFIRGLGGDFMLPGWILLPAWGAAEAFIVRGFWLDDLESVPWATLCAAVGLGAAISSGLRLVKFEAQSDALMQKRRSGGANSIVARAARMRSEGDPYEAFDLIQTAWREDPDDTDVAEAFYSIAVEVDQPGAAADAILPSLRTALRKGELALAIDYWFPLASHECDVPLEPTAFVRLGEALLDVGHVGEALFSLRGAMAAGASSSHAIRIVNIARDLDEELARAAATVAVADPDLEPKLRAELEGIASPPETSTPPHPAASPESPPESRSQLDRRIQAEHQTVEATAFALGFDDDFETPDMSFDFGLRADVEDFVDPRDDETDSDFTLLVDAPEELTSPLAGAGVDTSIAVFDQPTGIALAPPSPVSSTPAASNEDFAFGDEDACATTAVTLRALKAIEAVPVGATTDSIEIDADGRGKSKLPLSRIDGIAAALIGGLGPQPVLIIDCLLNWAGDSSEPLKLIRFRSDRFDPMQFVPEADNPLAALSCWIVELQAESDAQCLPSRQIRDGRFAGYASLAEYEREVLMASAEG